MHIHLKAGVLRRVAAQAQARGVTPDTLIARLVEAVAVDDIFRAVLDDGDA